MSTKPPPVLSAVVAISDNDIIGQDGDLPWRMRDDLRWFKSLTSGHPVIMGRRTYDSLGKPLPHRLNIVLTRQAVTPLSDAAFVASPETALEIGRSVAAKNNLKEVFVIGGASIYELYFPMISHFYVTHIHADVLGDTSLSLPIEGWHKDKIRQIEPDAQNDHPASIIKWSRPSSS